MRRRDLVALAVCTQPHAPVDMAKLNAFAAAYNHYIERLKGDVLDLAAWKECLEAWEKLR